MRGLRVGADSARRVAMRLKGPPSSPGLVSVFRMPRECRGVGGVAWPNPFPARQGVEMPLPPPLASSDQTTCRSVREPDPWKAPWLSPLQQPRTRTQRKLRLRRGPELADMCEVNDALPSARPPTECRPERANEVAKCQNDTAGAGRGFRSLRRVQVAVRPIMDRLDRCCFLGRTGVPWGVTARKSEYAPPYVPKPEFNPNCVS